MSYNPKKYKKLFPLGLFEYENKPIETWFDSHKLFAQNAIKQKFETNKIADGLIIKKGYIDQKDGFSNYLIAEIDPTKRDIDIEFFGNKMYYPLNAFKKIKKAKLLTNAGYFYLTDNESHDEASPPVIRTGNLVIENGRLTNLPILNRGCIYITTDNEIGITYLEAKGEVLINEKKYKWQGSKTGKFKKNTLIVYNSSNIEIPVVNDPVMGPSRKAVNTFIKNLSGNKLAVFKRTNKGFIVDQITQKNIVINDKDMVVLMPNNLLIKKGDLVRFLSIDQINIDNIKTAVSTGPVIFSSSEETMKEVDKEFSIPDMANPNNPHEAGKKLARGAFIKLTNNNFAIIAIDAIPQAGNIYPGVTMQEFIELINKLYPNFKSAIATDPSSSVKVVYKNRNKIEIFGNLHYLNHKKDKYGKIKFWPNGRLGRKLNSALVVY